MSDDVGKCENNNNVENGQHQRKESDCNSSSGGSVYQEFHGRQEEAMYSTDDEFLDATETIRSPLLSEDPEEQLSAPVLKQLRQEKENTRYIVVDMLTDSESVNNIVEHCKQNFENIAEPPGRENDFDCSKRPEKNKVSRTLRLPSTVALPTVKPDRPARGDGRPPVGVSKIPLPVTSMTKLHQLSTTPEQNRSELESCLRKPSKQPRPLRKSSTPTSENDKTEEDEDPECLNKLNTPETVCYAAALSVTPIPESHQLQNSNKPPSRSSRSSSKQSSRPSSRALTRPPSLPKEENLDTGSGNGNLPKEYPANEEIKKTSFSPQEQIISNDEKPLSLEKPRIKRARSLNKSVKDEQDVFTPTDTSLVNSTNEGTETKKMRIANRPSSREEQEKRSAKPAELLHKDPEKRRREIQAVRDRLAKDRLNLINSRERDELSGVKQNQMVVDSNVEQKTPDPIKSENTQKSASRKSGNGTSHIDSKVRSSLSNAGLEKRTGMHEKVPSSPRQLSPMVMNMSIIEKRKQWRQSREASNGDQKLNTKNANMPEIKPLLFKSNQLKTNQLGQRHQENISNVPLKSSVEDESLKKKTTLVEKRKMMMKQKEAINNANKPATGDVAQRTGKGLECPSREKPSLQASQKRSGCDIKKQSMGISKSTEKTTGLNSGFPMQDVQEELPDTDVQTKPSYTTNSKVTLASLQSVYKMQYKRCEEQLSEVKRAKDKLDMSLEKLEAQRNQMIQKFGEDAEEFIPPLYVVQSVVQNSPTVMTTTKGMNTEVLEEVAESLVLLGNNQQLKRDIENLRKQLEEAKEIGYANKKEDNVILDLKQRIRDMSLTLTLAEKRQQTLEDKMEEKQNEIVSLSNENKQMNDLLRQREQQLSALRKQNEEKNRQNEEKHRELESVHKKLAEANQSLQDELYKREVSQQKLMDEKNKIEEELREMDDKFAAFEEREECLNTMLENEKKKNKKLEELLSGREEELKLMVKKFFAMESSTSVITNQLQEKYTIIQELEIMKTTLLGHIRELCCLLSDMFALRGIEYNTDHIQALLSAGSLPALKEELLKVMEERIEEGNKALNEARSKIVELQNQVKILQIELEDSKMMSERLSNVITLQKPRDVDKLWDEHQRPWSSDLASARHAVNNNIIENSIRDNKSFRDGDMNILMPSINSSFACSDAAMARNNFNELFLLLERKRRQLLQLERKYQDMEEVHSHCAQKRTRNETRIAKLEMMLATYQG